MTSQDGRGGSQPKADDAMKRLDSEVQDATLFCQARDETSLTVKQLQAEVTLVRQHLVLPGWNGDNHGMPRMLYGYMMSCFSLVGLLSKYCASRGSKQTPRMVDFMCEYIGHDRRVNQVAVQLWRHTLMHNANPQAVFGEVTGDQYKWLLHWGPPHLPVEQHMTLLNDNGHYWILGIGLEYLVREIVDAATNLFQDAEDQDGLQINVVRAHKNVITAQTVAEL